MQSFISFIFRHSHSVYCIPIHSHSFSIIHSLLLFHFIPFIHSFIRFFGSFIHSHSFSFILIHSQTFSFIHSFHFVSVRSFNLSIFQSFNLSSFILSFLHSFILSFFQWSVLPPVCFAGKLARSADQHPSSWISVVSRDLASAGATSG